MLDSQGPVLISEPRSSVEFSNETGAMIHCSAQGSPLPRIDWLMGDESPVLPIPHIREMLVNGSMYFLPFGAETYRHDVHSAVYRCQASNSVGRVLGREITVKAGEYLYFFASHRPPFFAFFLSTSRSYFYHFTFTTILVLALFFLFFPSSSLLFPPPPLLFFNANFARNKRAPRITSDIAKRSPLLLAEGSAKSFGQRSSSSSSFSSVV